MRLVQTRLESWPWAVVRNGPAGFVRAKIRRAAGEIVVDSGQADAGIDRGRAGTKLEVEVRGL